MKLQKCHDMQKVTSDKLIVRFFYHAAGIILVLKQRIAILFCILIIMALSAPQFALSESMNLSGSLNLNEIQQTSNTSLFLSLAVSLAESIIPIVVGAAVGHKAMRYWQEKKSKIASKNQVIEDYLQSFKRSSTLLDGFVKRTFDAYIIFEQDTTSNLIMMKDYTDENQNIRGFLKFPTNKDEQPSNRFIEEYKEFVLELDRTNHARNRLYSYLAIFYKDGDKTIQKLKSIENLLNKSKLVINKFFHSANEADFVKFYDKYFVLSGEIVTQTENIESELAQLKFR